MAQSQKNWLEHLSRGNKQRLSFWSTAKSSMKTPKYETYYIRYLLIFFCNKSKKSVTRMC